ncbi:MAG: VOC family protein [Mycobacterium sp.]
MDIRVTSTVVEIATGDLRQALAFYRLLGLDVPEPDGPHVEVELPGGNTLAFDEEEITAGMHPGWTPPTQQGRVALAFRVSDPSQVDALFERITAAGNPGALKPFDQPRCAAEPQDAPQHRGPVAVHRDALTLQCAARPADVACHIGYGAAVFETVGDVVQLAKRPRRRLLRRLVGGKGSGKLDQRAVPRALDAELHQRNTGVAQLRCRNAEQPGQGSWPKP